VIKHLIMYPWPADPTQFKRHYMERHLPLCQVIPGTLHIRYAFAPKTLQGGQRWFCIYESEYRDSATFAAALASSECRCAVEDVRNFSQAAPSAFTYEVWDWNLEDTYARENT
jgi:uncharacterized protein (TIGR02118 family)